MHYYSFFLLLSLIAYPTFAMDFFRKFAAKKEEKAEVVATILDSIEKNDSEAVRQFLEKGMNPSYIDDKNVSLLYYAILAKANDVVKVLC